MSPSQAAVGLDVGAVQAALAADGIDGWLLYDFRGLNPIAADVTGVGRQGGHLATRRWYYLIPAAGEPRGLVHAIEPNSLAHLPGTTERYAGREQLEAGLRTLLDGHAPRRDGVLARLRDPLRLPGRRRHDRARPPGGRRGRVVGRSRPALLGGLGRRTRSPRIGRRRRSCTASRIGRSRRSRSGCATASRRPNTTSSS